MDPQLVDPANGDFHLQPTSPCIASGLDGYDRGARWYTNRLLPVDFLGIDIADSLSTVTLHWQNPLAMLDGSPAPLIMGAKIFRNDSLIAMLPDLTPGATLQYNDTLPQPGNYIYQISVYDPNGLEGIRRRTARSWGGGLLKGIVIWNLDPNPISKDALVQTLNDLQYDRNIFVVNDPNALDLTQDVEAVFVLLGVQPDIYLLGNGASDRLIVYLAAGGNVYLEGGDFWSDPLTQQLAVYQYFHITSLGPGQNDLTQVEGVPGSLMDGLSYYYGGANNSIDEMTNQYDSELILKNPADDKGCAVAYNAYLYRTIGTSFQFGGLADGTAPNTKKEFLTRVLNFFNIQITGLKPSANPSALLPEGFVLETNYPNPFNATTNILFQTPGQGKVLLEVYNLLGQQITTLSMDIASAGKHQIRFNARDLTSGVYFYRLRWYGSSGIRVSSVKTMHYIR